MYTDQNVMGLKGTKNKHIMLQHIKISGLDKLRWLYGKIYKTRQI